MKKYPKIVQADHRGQFVIPKEVRHALGITAGTGFWIYAVGDEGIFLKRADAPSLDETPAVKELRNKADKLNIKKGDIDKAQQRYKKEGQWEEI